MRKHQEKEGQKGNVDTRLMECGGHTAPFGATRLSNPNPF